MTLHHEISGPDSAPVLLLGGSLGATTEMWERQLPLGDAYRLVCFDHRGHGRSPEPPGPYEIADLAADVLELMDALGVHRASYVGVSLGGMVGMWLGSHAPERMERLVLVCTAAHMPPASAWQERAAVVRAAGSTEPIADAVVDRWLTPDHATADPELRARLRTMLVASPPHGYVECCGAIERMDLRPMLSRVAAPTLVISGSEDPSTPPERQREIAAAIPGARYESVGPAAHFAVVEQAEAVNRLIREHLG
ncbi:MAG TPA: 3-oxoadipate enol-lactonase [Solirubrobacteraceae bacterium]|nr:3-oxoadipate enol-lactonase [Solirubrobacteraceae bacterium]